MARPLRNNIEDGLYHAMNRGMRGRKSALDGAFLLYFLLLLLLLEGIDLRQGLLLLSFLPVIE